MSSCCEIILRNGNWKSEQSLKYYLRQIQYLEKAQELTLARHTKKVAYSKLVKTNQIAALRQQLQELELDPPRDPTKQTILKIRLESRLALLEKNLDLFLLRSEEKHKRLVEQSLCKIRYFQTKVRSLAYKVCDTKSLEEIASDVFPIGTL